MWNLFKSLNKICTWTHGWSFFLIIIHLSNQTNKVSVIRFFCLFIMSTLVMESSVMLMVLNILFVGRFLFRLCLENVKSANLRQFMTHKHKVNKSAKELEKKRWNNNKCIQISQSHHFPTSASPFRFVAGGSKYFSPLMETVAATVGWSSWSLLFRTGSFHAATQMLGSCAVFTFRA